MSNLQQTKAPEDFADQETVAPKAAVAAVARSGKEKAPSAFRTISEVADELDVPQHVLRFWETKFSQIKPLKRGGGRRYYRPEDVALLKRIHSLLYTEGYTIKGVQKLLKGQGKTGAAEVVATGPRVMAVEPAAVELRPAAPAAAAVAAAAEPKASARPPLSDKQKAILEAMLGDLRDLRDMIRGEE
ncbi:MAG: MerR family transcriptional regulator [Micavibrio aeruginosavorus]|uniref:MerR family transcriptional regulator n=1 Tax=Micavibrio aeruginosavorus TaxID=349221 RepID=A0A7T5UFI8_9BACT|nr:MAG: MerR family transcriptional regulator [Micavibrio aeruginosavorus]